MDIRELLLRHEGLRLRPYHCTAGALTIGVGHNLDARGISRRIAMELLTEDIADVQDDLDRRVSFWRTLDPVRQAVFIDMCFNLGIDRFCAFSKMLDRVRAEDWNGAAREMHNSMWAAQVGMRAHTLAAMMISGEWPR